MKMKMTTENMMMLGGAAMAVGVAAAVTAGVVSSKKSPKAKMKKFAKNSVKAMDNIVGGINSLMK